MDGTGWEWQFWPASECTGKVRIVTVSYGTAVTEWSVSERMGVLRLGSLGMDWRCEQRTVEDGLGVAVLVRSGWFWRVLEGPGLAVKARYGKS